MPRWLVAVVLCLIPPLHGWTAEFVAIPALSARVTDLTGTLSAEQRQALENASTAIERDKGAQVAVLMLPTTRPETIEQFGIRLAEAWKIGRAGVDDGVIVIVAKDDRKMRIEVGYGLEGAIPDAVAKRIVAELMGPRFRQGDFAGGLEAAVTTLGGLVRGESLPPAATPDRQPGDGADRGIFLFLTILFGGFLRSLLGLAGSLLAAALAGALAWGLFASWFAAAIAALLTFFLSFMRPGGDLGGGGFSSGGRGGGGGRSGGGGGFSGGGGGFGGGGASGSW